jgi:FAD-linked sulfhydryl oxidase
MEENKRASSGDSASRNVVGGGEAEQKPCRACYDFRTWMTRKFKADDAPTSSKTSAAGLVNASSSAPTANADEEEVRACGFMRPPKNPAAQKPLPPDCPVDKARLGRGSWDLLHTMAAHYDTAPDAQRQTQMTQFLQLFSQFYPCDWCASKIC